MRIWYHWDAGDAGRLRMALSAAIRGIDDGLRDAVTVATRQFRDYARQITHRDTGTLARAHTSKVERTAGGVRGPRYRGTVYIGQGLNPRTGFPAAFYGPFEHARGGVHAFYARTIRELGPSVRSDIRHAITSRLP